jgi:hypothetical protein
MSSAFYNNNNWSDYRNTSTAAAQAPVGSDQAEANNLINQLNNPALLKEGALGALYGLLMYAAKFCQQKEVQVRSEMAQQNAKLTQSQAQVAQSQASAIQLGAEASALGEIGSGAITVSGGLASGAKLSSEQTKLNSLHQKSNELQKQIDKGPSAQTTQESHDTASLLREKAALDNQAKSHEIGIQHRIQTISQMHDVGSKVTGVVGQTSSANAQAQKTLLETTGQQMQQASSQLQDSQKTAGEVADQLTQLLALSGQAAKAAAGR